MALQSMRAPRRRHRIFFLPNAPARRLRSGLSERGANFKLTDAVDISLLVAAAYAGNAAIV